MEVENDPPWRKESSRPSFSISMIMGERVPSLNIYPLKMDAWNTSLSFWDGLFSGAKMLVSGSGPSSRFLWIFTPQILRDSPRNSELTSASPTEARPKTSHLEDRHESTASDWKVPPKENERRSPEKKPLKKENSSSNHQFSGG